ncbi:MAG: hypothetical protein SH808_13015, partial [Saprospiraceae bacterium]|nr:hypothetical protein [Saprospiraceae bacterium]
MNNHTNTPNQVLTIAFIMAMGLCNLAMAQIPNVSVRLANPTYECSVSQYCLDVEFQTDLDSVELFGMNVRFFYNDVIMELDSFTDFQGGYGPVAPDPPSVLTSPPGFGTTFFGFPAPGIADWVNGAIQLVDNSQPPIYIDTVGWTKIFQICFSVEGPIADSSNFCPPIVWDLELDPANGGYLGGDDGVVITVVNAPPAMSGPSTESVVQFNWMYTGNGITQPYGIPVETECSSLFCAPVIVCPADLTLDCTASTDTSNTGSATATVGCITNFTIDFTDETVLDQCGQNYTINRTWIAVNDCNESDTCVQVITVIDTVAPILICPPFITIQCDESTDPSNTGMATASDACDPTPEVTYIDIPKSGPCPQQYTIDRIWFGTDSCGNTSIFCRQEIQIIDTTPPVITCPADLTMECSDPLPNDSPTATDNCSPTDSITYSFADIGCDNPILGFNDVYDINNWTPIALFGGSVIPMGDSMVMLESPDGNIPCPNGASVLFQIVIPSTGQLVFDWDFITSDVNGPLYDPFGYNLNGTFFQLTDDNGPDVQFGTATVNVTAGDIFAFEQNSIDCILGSGASTIVEFFACIEQFDPVCSQLIVRTHTATDQCGNSANCVQTIYLEDTTIPTITCPANLTIECSESTLPDNTGLAVATDNCDAALAITYDDVTASSMTCAQEYSITRTWTATDNCGNSTACIQTIIVDDSTPPTITTCTANITIECDESTDPSITGLTSATDNCDPAPIVTFSDATVGGACPQEYTITRTWTATDACGNGTNCTQIITVDDSTPPTITTCAANITIECDESTDPSNTGLTSATDNCDPAPVVTFGDVTIGGACPQEYTITRTWTATDACGNGTNCTQVITV